MVQKKLVQKILLAAMVTAVLSLNLYAFVTAPDTEPAQPIFMMRLK